jgi:hypothetical protein
VCAGPAGAASQCAAAEPAPRGHGTAVANPGQWRAHLLTHRRARALADGRLAELHQELAGYPAGTDESVPANGVVLALHYRRASRSYSNAVSPRHGGSSSKSWTAPAYSWPD